MVDLLHNNICTKVPPERMAMTRRSREAKKLLFEDLERDHSRQSQDTDYQPLASVWFGEDAEGV
jgi:hypothetical protein